MDAVRAWLREPVVHFLAAGLLLFLLHEAFAGGSRGPTRIVVSAGQIESIAATFARTWQRPPTAEELKGQITEFVREEIAYREAREVGLDRDDTIIRRRLRQKLEFVAEDAVELVPPTDADLQRWLDDHPGRFAVDPRVTFRQIFLDPQRRGAELAADARSLVEQLADAGPEADIGALGDSALLSQEIGPVGRTEVARLFGEAFADGLVSSTVGRWTGPLRSGYGAHVVLVRARVDGRIPALAEVRREVERDLVADRRRRQIDSLYARLLERYEVVVERSPAPSLPAAPKRTEGAR